MYQDITEFKKFQRYWWFSLEKSDAKDSWAVGLPALFLQDQNNHRTELKLTQDQIKFIDNICECLNSNSIKYLISIYLHILGELFQTHPSQLHLISPQSKDLLDSYLISYLIIQKTTLNF